MWTFEDWVVKTRLLQVDAYGSDPELLDGKEFADFVMWNVLAAEDELHEMLAEIPWKPWSTRRERPDQDARDRAVNEIVDVMHFLGNLLVALHATGDELTKRYEEKMTVNYRRMERGYDASEKCSNCHRDYNEAGGQVAGTRLCTVCFEDSAEGEESGGRRLPGSRGSVHPGNEASRL
jgi:hypothetical protein